MFVLVSLLFYVFCACAFVLLQQIKKLHVWVVPYNILLNIFSGTSHIYTNTLHLFRIHCECEWCILYWHLFGDRKYLVFVDNLSMFKQQIVFAIFTKSKQVSVVCQTGQHRAHTNIDKKKLEIKNENAHKVVMRKSVGDFKWALAARNDKIEFVNTSTSSNCVQCTQHT